MIAIFAIIQMFCSTWNSILLTVAPGVITYKRFALIIAIISAIVILKLLNDAGWKMPKATFRIFIIYFLLVIAYLITPFFYHGVGNDRYESFRLVLIGQIYPSVLTASLISYREKIQSKIKEIAPFVGFLFSIIAFISSRFPDMQTTGGFAENSNGLNYQSIAYTAAFASSLAETSLISNDFEEKRRWVAFLNYITIIVSLISILLAGGRGGFVLYVFFAILTLIMSRKSFSINGLLKFIAIILLILVGGYIAVKYAVSSDVATSGIKRITGLLNGVGDNGRSDLRSQALTIFQSSPVFGHGLGSVFYEMSLYSHNIFTDSLVETGIIGTCILTIIMVITVIKGFKLVKRDRSDTIWLYLFFCGFIEGMFSGYYLTQIPMYCAIVMILSKPLYEYQSIYEDEAAELNTYNG